jgi:unsaturated rhamnogalacturonyl hydrolase
MRSQKQKMNKLVRNTLLAIGAMALVAPMTLAEHKDFSKWPAGQSPREVGKRAAERFVATPHTNFGRGAPPEHITYPEAVSWYGALQFAKLSGDKELSGQLISRFDRLLDAEASLVPTPVHVDSTVFAAVPFEIYIQTKQQKYLDLAKSLVDKQWENPRPNGLTSQSRFWIDDMYMITVAQVQAYRATGEAKYIDRAALSMAVYLDKLQQPSGLFYHAPDVRFYWGRGNGWVAAGMAELLRSLPEKHPSRSRILDAYRLMMASLLKYQAKDGMWRQLLDHPESWEESSCTAMFTFAMVTGVKNGWLGDDKSYVRAARKGWLALVRHIDSDGDLSDVCEGTNKKNDVNYYLNRARITGDLHGQAPVMWCASEFLR